MVAQGPRPQHAGGIAVDEAVVPPQADRSGDGRRAGRRAGPAAQGRRASCRSVPPVAAATKMLMVPLTSARAGAPRAAAPMVGRRDRRAIGSGGPEDLGVGAAVVAREVQIHRAEGQRRGAAVGGAVLDTTVVVKVGPADGAEAPGARAAVVADLVDVAHRGDDVDVVLGRVLHVPAGSAHEGPPAGRDVPRVPRVAAVGAARVEPVHAGARRC